MLSDTKLRHLRPKAKVYSIADGGGLSIEVTPGGVMRWFMRYRFNNKNEKVNFGNYPGVSLADARRQREEARMMLARGESPAAAAREKKSGARSLDTVEGFGRLWLTEIVQQTVQNPETIERVLNKDVFPAIGAKRLTQVTPADVLAVTDAIKRRGSDSVALLARNVLKRLFGYAIARQKCGLNPAAAIEACYIATARSRDVALTADEIGRLLRGIYQSNMRRANKLALHLLLITLVRKGELIGATWNEVSFERREWVVPADRMKMDREHIVYLSSQAVAIFEELKILASGSDYVLPSRNTLESPIAHSTLNAAIRTLDLNLRDFVLHDLRRTASTHLHEAGFNSDWVEKALAHEQQGIRAVYNKAQYADQRRKMLQWWSDFVDAQIESPGKLIIGQFGKAIPANQGG